MIAETSRKAYESIEDLGDKQHAVYEAIKTLHRATNEEIAAWLGWTINRVTGRVTELHRYDFIAVDGIALTKSGRSAKVWVAKDPGDRALLGIAQECGV